MKEKSSEEKAYQEIIKMIISQEFLPGSVLVEAQLADRLGMSRTPIRNAIKKLVGAGLLDNPTGRSCSVPMLSRKDLDDLFQLRILIEPVCARRAAIHAKPGERARFERLLSEEGRYGHEEKIPMHDINEDIHFGLAKLSGSEYLVRALRQCFWRCQLYLFFFDSFFYTNPASEAPDSSASDVASIKDHVGLIDAVFAHDEARAEEIMRNHVTSTYELLTSRGKKVRTLA